ncbi:ARM repeat-containing protein [Mycena sanguinolenta]|uniref:ARM repeat-containing protein n=1 Tax=Mycena sanguinolenta TaxID=230812 RepID=A0A8H6Y3T5_9AGAR|nr:ARM repeat-containing protein [Mycena sanguinolenta]
MVFRELLWSIGLHGDANTRSRLRKISGNIAVGGPRSLLDAPPRPPVAYADSTSAFDPVHMKRKPSTLSGNRIAASGSTENVYSEPLTPSKLQKFGLHSSKDVTAGTISTYILLLKSGLGSENVLVALGLLIDPVTANMIHRMGASAALIEVIESSESENTIALAVWCITRVCRNAEIANDLLKQNLAKLLVTKGLKGTQRTACIAGWCLGALICSAKIAETLTEMGFIPSLCENIGRCAEWSCASPEDHCAAIYAIARISRSVRATEVLAQSGWIQTLERYLMTTDSPMVAQWSARAVGCLLGQDSTDMATMLLDAGVVKGLARLPSILLVDEVEPLEAFAFALQRLSSADWGGQARKALVDAGVVEALLSAQIAVADKRCPELHVELAHTTARVADVGGAPVRKQIINAGGVEILKRVSSLAIQNDVQEACNLAVKSVSGNLWSRNAASSKAALLHDWSGACPYYLPDCPVSVNAAQKGDLHV